MYERQIQAGILKVAYEPTRSNKADMLTKKQSGIERQRIAQTLLFS
jgi:hypothetical protein